mmetsp:Transcript_7508/g.18503  ORF Transcript_7508/g.18503 Transcript_7508/m.18503 type:complete len:187 (-) Transcript_7508:10-570(-)
MEKKHVNPMTTTLDEDRKSKGKDTAKKKGLQYSKFVPDTTPYPLVKRDDSHMDEKETGFLPVGKAAPTHAYDVGGEWKLLYHKPATPKAKPKDSVQKTPRKTPKKAPTSTNVTPKKTPKTPKEPKVERKLPDAVPLDPPTPKKSPKRPTPPPKPAPKAAPAPAPPPPPPPPPMKINVETLYGRLFH